jgi:hypothetical protein
LRKYHNYIRLIMDIMEVENIQQKHNINQ